MSAANFDCGLLLESKVKLDQIWQDSQQETDYIAEVEALRVIQANQRGATFTELQDPNKDRMVKVSWLSNCPDSTNVTDITDVCN